jgi:hypothetical protein
LRPLAATTSLLASTVALLLRVPVDGQEYRSSVVGTDFDFITEADPIAFERLEYEGEALYEMPDKTSSAPLRQHAFVFVATFRDGARVRIYLGADFGSEAAAREEALRYTPSSGGCRPRCARASNGWSSTGAEKTRARSAMSG